jgi:hypothetical protein
MDKQESFQFVDENNDEDENENDSRLVFGGVCLGPTPRALSMPPWKKGSLESHKMPCTFNSMPMS